jgi:transposase, IS5 family
MKQTTLAMAADQGAGIGQYRERTRREVSLAQVETVVPWAELGALIELHYPKPCSGRPPICLQRMHLIHLLQQWFSLADEAVKGALCDSASPRVFVGTDLGCEPLPDATSLLRFGHLLERHDLGQAIFDTVGQLLRDRGLRLSGDNIVDATLIAAPSSAKTAERRRDPEMGQTKKRNQSHFGMKVHVGANALTGLLHAAVVNSANAHDEHALPDLLHGDKTPVYGDRGHHSCIALIKEAAPQAKDFTNRRMRQPWDEDEVARSKNRIKNRTRAQVVHVFLVRMRQFGFAKVRYRGLAKSANRGSTALVNLIMALRRTPRLWCVRSGSKQPTRAPIAAVPTSFAPSVAGSERFSTIFRSAGDVGDAFSAIS